MDGLQTDRLRTALSHASQCAHAMLHGDVDTEHLLIGLLRDDGNRACILLDKEFKAETVELRQRLEQLLVPGNSAPQADLRYTPAALRCFERAYTTANFYGHNYVGTEHMLLGISVEAKSRAAACLHECGATPERLKHCVVAAEKELAITRFGDGEKVPAESPPPFFRRKRVYVGSILAMLFGPAAFLLSFHDNTLATPVFIVIFLAVTYLPLTYDRPHAGWGYFWKGVGALHATAALAASVMAMHEAEGPGMSEIQMRWWLGVAWCWVAAVVGYMAGDTQLALAADRQKRAATNETQHKNAI
jgi:hypothetical protein